ncbi:MAG: GAF domain-containing protein [Elusimicrobia bacterium]|nr:GAF domain-containing protein [Elusimicrobiota bacterium]
MAGARDILFDSVKALERQTAGLHMVSQFATSTAPKEHVLNDLLGKVLEWVGAEAGAIALAEEGAGVFELAALRWAHLPVLQAAAKEKALRLFRVRLTEGIVGQVYQSGEPVILPDVSKNQAFRKDMADAVNYQVLNLLSVPLQLEGKRVGVLELFNKTPKGTFSASDMELAVSLAQQIALVLEVTRLRGNGSSNPSPVVPPPGSGPSSDEFLEARRMARDAQSQLKETHALLEIALQSRDVNARQVQVLTEELEKAKALTDAATPAEQRVRLLRSIEPLAFSLDPQTVMRNFGELAARLVNAQALQLFVWAPKNERFSLGFSTAGMAPNIGNPPSFKKGEGLAGCAADRMGLVQVEDVTREDHFSKSIDEVPGIMTRSVLAGPLLVEGRLVGVVEAINRKDGLPFSTEDGESLSGLALLGAVALDKAFEHQMLRDTAFSILACNADLLDSPGGGAGRADRLRRMVVLLGKSLHWSPQALREAEWASLLFNRGKVGIPPEILSKTGDLLPKDRELLLSVPRISSEGLASDPLLSEAAILIRHVNERWDGEGTPDRLTGEEIPMASRVIALVESFDGLTAGFQGRKPLPLDVALKEVESCSGKQFDPALVTLLQRLVRAGELPLSLA